MMPVLGAVALVQHLCGTAPASFFNVQAIFPGVIS